MPITKLIDPKSIKTSGKGRPSKFGEKSKQITFSLPESTIEVLEEHAGSQKLQDAIRNIIFERVDLWEFTEGEG